MGKIIKLNKRNYFLILIVALTFSSFVVFGKAEIFSFDIDQFKEIIQSSPDDSWKKPAQNRKDTICNKLTELQELIDAENFGKAYDKLLFDIKPKITGLRTDELEQPWGNGVFDQAWVICENLKEVYRIECNLILAEINPLSIYDDDKTPPEISIIYEGEQYISNPGVWYINVEDLESGLDLVSISVNGIEELYDLQGEWSAFYEIQVPAIAGINTIEVTAINNDKDFEGDQESSSESEWITILNTPTGTNVEVSDEETGIDINFNEVTDVGVTSVEQIVDGPEFPSDFIPVSDYYDISTDATFSGPIVIAIPYDETQVNEQLLKLLHWDTIIGWTDITIDVDMINNIIYGEVYGLSIFLVAEEASQDDDTPPDITIIGGFPGYWWVFVEDLESGLDEIIIKTDGMQFIHDTNLNGIISVYYSNIFVPVGLGYHILQVIAINNDKDYIGDQEVSNQTDTTLSFQIKTIMDDDYTGPAISIEYEGDNIETNPGVWHVHVEDLESELDEILIEINGVPFIHDIDLNIISMNYDVSVPALAGIYTITVTAINNDKDFEGDQETSIKSNIVDINLETIPPDDDLTGPTILISYVEKGFSYGFWELYIEDLESGLHAVQVLIDGVEFIHDQDLNGIQSKLYNVWVLAQAWSAGSDWHSVEVFAVNNDKDCLGDEELTTQSDLVYIIDTDPVIDIYPEDIQYVFGTTGHTITWFVSDDNPKSFQFFINGDLYGSGRWSHWSPITINIDGLAIGTYQVKIIIYDTSNNFVEDIVLVDVYEADNTPPVIFIHYDGSYVVNDPGEWKVYVYDEESGLGEIYISLSFDGQIYHETEENLVGTVVKLYIIPLQGLEGTHYLTVILKNDIAYDGVQEMNSLIDIPVEIGPYIPPVPG